MNLVLTHCWREWRAQRGLLAGFAGLGFVALVLVFTLVPATFWLEDGQRALALSWFVALGGIGVVGFVAPALVRGEFGTKGDQFVRRLPGALRPSFGGKLLFLALVATALPLLGLVVGQLFLAALGRGPADLFRWDFAGDVYVRWPWPVVWLGYAALLIPWVWAIGTWLPNGRMALGGTILFVLLLGLAVVPVLRQSPGLEKSLAYEPWFVVVPLLGLVVAAVSWILGRRGGGAFRSARWGLLVTGLGLLPPGSWLTWAAYHYHHPDPQHLGRFETYALTPDLQFALVQGAGHEEHSGSVPFRIDLRDGRAQQLGGVHLGLFPEVVRPSGLGPMAMTRYFGACDYDPWRDRIVGYRVLDLVRGTWILHHEGAEPLAWRHTVLEQLPDAVVRGRASLLRAPGDVPVWFEGGELCFQVAADRVERVRWEGELPVTFRACGHGFHAFGGREGWFDLTTRTFVPPTAGRDVLWFVGGVQLWQRHARRNAWERRDPGADEFVAVPELAHADVLGLLDDHHLLARRIADKQTELLTWNAATGAVEVLPLPFRIGQRSLGVVGPLHQCGSLLPRDPSGKLWFMTPRPPQHAHDLLLRLDPTTRSWETLLTPTDDPAFRLLAWPDARSALVQQHDGIDRVDLATGARTRLFPR